MKTTIHVKSGHTLFLEMIEEVPDWEYMDIVTGPMYAVKNWDKDGPIFFYVSKCGKEWLVWYRNSKKLWSSYGKTIKSAIEGAQRDGWMYA